MLASKRPALVFGPAHSVGPGRARFRIHCLHLAASVRQRRGRSDGQHKSVQQLYKSRHKKGSDTISTSRRSLSALGALLILAALYFLVINPIPPQQGSHAGPPALVTTPATVAGWEAPINRVRTTTAAPDGPAGRAGSRPPCAPSGLAIPELGVDAPVIQVGRDAYGNVGVTSDADKTKAGWFPSTLAGSPRGSVILTGHTYHDETAIFKTDFNRKAHLGMALRLSCLGVAPLSYRVTAAKLDLPVEDYADYVDSHRLYATDGPPKVVIITCTDWNPIRRDYDQRGVLIATPH